MAIPEKPYTRLESYLDAIARGVSGGSSDPYPGYDVVMKIDWGEYEGAILKGDFNNAVAKIQAETEPLIVGVWGIGTGDRASQYAFSSVAEYWYSDGNIDFCIASIPSGVSDVSLTSTWEWTSDGQFYTVD